MRRTITDVPAGLASEILLEIDLKPVVRELHDEGHVDEARERWESLGYHTAVGAPVREDADTAAMVVDVDVVHTIRHLADHPVVQRAVEVGGGPARWLLLDAGSPVYQWLCERLGADRPPHLGARPGDGNVRVRQAVYVSKRAELAAQAREQDRMAADAATEVDALALGELLGYPACCVSAFCAQEQRWPNRLPIQASAARSRRFLPRLNNLALDRFAWIAWFPCRYDCGASARLADAAAAHLAEREPELVAALDELLARPRLFLDDSRQAVLDGAQQVGAGRLEFKSVTDLDAIWPPRGDRPDNSDWLRPLAGATRVRLTPDGPIFTDAGGGEARLADPVLLLPFAP